MLLLKEYVKPQQTKFLIHPTEGTVNEEMTVDLELRSVVNDTLREATLVPPSITVEQQTHKSTIVPPSRSTANKKLQGDWAARDRSIFTSPAQQQLPVSKPRSRRGSNASETDGDIPSQQHTWASRVERTPEKLPIQPLDQSLVENNTSRESSPYKSTPTGEQGGRNTPPTSDSRAGINRRHSCEPSVRRGYSGDYKRVVSSPNLVAQGTGRPRSQGFEYNRGGYYKASRYNRGSQYGAGRNNWSAAHTPTQQLGSSTPDFHQPQLVGAAVYTRSQSDTRGVPPPSKEHSFTSSARSEPINNSVGASGEWTEVRRKSTKPKNHPPSTKGKSNPKDRWQRR